MNPPFNDPIRHQRSPDAVRRLAHAAPVEGLPAWVRCASRLLGRRGVLTLIWRADGLDRVLAALSEGFGAITVLPVHPRPDRPAVRVIVRAVKASRAALTLLPSLGLRDEAGVPTPAAEAVLRDAGTLPLAET